MEWELYCPMSVTMVRRDHAVAFASRTLTAAERKYAQIDKEGLAVIFAVKRFLQYVFGHHFTLVSDHKPLMRLLGECKPVSAMASARMQRWAATLAGYSYTFRYKPGQFHGTAEG